MMFLCIPSKGHNLLTNISSSPVIHLLICTRLSGTFAGAVPMKAGCSGMQNTECQPRQWIFNPVITSSTVDPYIHPTCKDSTKISYSSTSTCLFNTCARYAICLFNLCARDGTGEENLEILEEEIFFIQYLCKLCRLFIQYLCTVGNGKGKLGNLEEEI